MEKALVIGGASGIGLAVALELAKRCESVCIADIAEPKLENGLPANCNWMQTDLTQTDFKWLERFNDIDTLFISAGIGRVAGFENLHSKEIDKIFRINTIATFKTLHHFMKRMQSDKPFYCGVMVSIAGRIASPLFSVYSASKAALFRGIEAINTELAVAGTPNRVLEVSPGSIQGTSFNGNDTELNRLTELASAIIGKMESHNTLYIPQYEETFRRVIGEYTANPEEFALQSYNYKKENGRISSRPQVKIGYLSGTFDLFHIGHLNLLRRARQHCDYLVVGVHKDASHKGKTTFIPFEERMEILRSIKYVDDVIESEREDSDVYTKGIVKYDRLFVGSDYKGTERFNRYEEYFKDKGVEIVYFPYTTGTSSTQLRDALSVMSKK